MVSGVGVALDHRRLVGRGPLTERPLGVRLRLAQVEQQRVAVPGRGHLDQVVLEERDLEADSGAAAGGGHVHGDVPGPVPVPPASAGVRLVQLVGERGRVGRDDGLLDLELELGAAVHMLGDGS